MSEETQCRLCLAYIPPWDVGDESSAIKCAFDGEHFRCDNWNCATANAVRILADCDIEAVSRFYGNDQTWAFIATGQIYSLDDEPQVLAVSWYKRRGRTEQLFFLNTEDEPIQPVSWGELMKVLQHYRSDVPALDEWLVDLGVDPAAADR